MAGCNVILFSQEKEKEKKSVYRFPHEPDVPQGALLAMPVNQLPFGPDFETVVLSHDDL